MTGGRVSVENSCTLRPDAWATMTHGANSRRPLAQRTHGTGRRRPRASLKSWEPVLRAADHLDDAGLADMVAGEFDAIFGSQLWVDTEYLLRDRVLGIDNNSLINVDADLVHTGR